jgi:hypothetical protein
MGKETEAALRRTQNALNKDVRELLSRAVAWKRGFLGLADQTGLDSFLPTRWTIEGVLLHGLPWLPEGTSGADMIADVKQLGCAHRQSTQLAGLRVMCCMHGVRGSTHRNAAVARTHPPC